MGKDVKKKIVYQETSIGSSVKTKKVETGEIKTGMFVGGKNHQTFVGFGSFMENALKELGIASTVVTPHFGLPSMEQFRALQNAFARFSALEKKITNLSKIFSAFSAGDEDYRTISYNKRDEVYKKISENYK